MTDGLAPPRAATARSIRLRRRRIEVGGRPELLLGGEVHYFRLRRADWRDRLDRLRDCGANTVATYVPWLWHELPDRSYDLVGRTHEQRDLAGYLDLAAELGLYVIARPGPFVMAELKNEGVPYRVYDAPGVLPVTWDCRTVPTRTADYLAGPFLAAAREWYAAVMPVLADRLLPTGRGTVAGVQLDNEIGMLSWITNAPDLTDAVCADVARWSVDRWGTEEAAGRLGADPGDLDALARSLRTPPEPVSLALHHALGEYMRDRYRRYVALLREDAERHGVTGVPFLVNVHGTDQGRGRTYPIGLSQLRETWRDQPQLTPGSDLYLRDLTVENVADLYLANAFGAAVQDDDQPLTSLEFECGSGDHGEDLSLLNPPETVELKTRLSLAQGNRLINVYLFTGGHNPPLDEPVGDGNDRIAFTGERHGFAAPIGPEGRPGLTYPATRRAMSSVAGIAELVADMDQVYDGIALGLVADHYLTEYHHPHSAARTAQVVELERFRGMGPRDVLARALVLGGYSFPGVDLQAAGLDVATTPVLALSTGTTMSADVQGRLADYVTSGGRLLLVGLLPSHDHEGRDCSVLADALGVHATGRVDAGLQYFPSVVPHGWAAPGAETRTTYAQLLSAPTGTPVLTEVGSGQPCAVDVPVGDGRAVVLGCDYPCRFDFWHAALAALGTRRRWVAETDGPGLVVTPAASPDGQQLVHLVHVGPAPVTVSLRRDGTAFLDGRCLALPARSARSLPVDVRLARGQLLAASTELVARPPDGVVVRRTAEEDVVVLDTDRDVRSDGGRVDRDGTRVTLILPGAGRAGVEVPIRIG